MAVVNEAFVKRFFKSDEDPLDQHFGLDLPENVDTFRIVGVVRDAKFAGFGLEPAGAADVLRAAGAERGLQERADEAHRAAVAFHRRHACWSPTPPPGALEPLVTRALAEVDPNLTITSVRTMQQQVDAVVRSGARGREPRRPVRRRRAAAGGGRPVRRHRLHRGAADERDRHPHGARRRSRQRWSTLVLRGAFTRVVVGLDPRLAAGGRRRPPDRGAALRRVVLGSARAGGGGRFARPCARSSPRSFRPARAASISPMRALRAE